jgi:hypothetical protein
MFKRFVMSALIFAAGFALCALTYGSNVPSLAKGALSNQARLVTPPQAAQNPCTPQFWEYRVVTNYDLYKPNVKDINRDLNQFGLQGFEIYQAFQTSPDSGSILTILLRRPRQ